MKKAFKVSKKVRIAIIGFGGMAGWHLGHMRKSGLFDVVGAYDIDPKRLSLARKKGLKAYKSADALLAESGLEAVLIATPNDFHEEYAIKVANAKLNVICEKPITLSSESLERMIEATQRNNVKLIVHQNRRWDTDFRKIRELYKNDTMGKMYKVDSNVTGSHGLPGAWRRIKAKGGGMLWDWGVHLIDQILTMTEGKKVVGVTCKGSYVYGFDCDDGIYLTLDFEDGFVANINIDTNKFIKTPRWYAYGLNGTAVVEGWNNKGKVVTVKTFLDKKNKGITAGNGFTKTMADRSKGTTKVSKLPSVPDATFDYYKNIYDSIVSGESQAVTPESVMRCMLVMEAGFKSMERKRTIFTNI